MSEQVDSPVPAFILGLAYGIGSILVVGCLVNVLVGPGSKSAIVVGLIAGYWFARKYFYAKSTEIEESKEEVNQLEELRRPFPRAYQIPLPHLFSQVRDILEGMVFGVGNKWIINTDTPRRRMTAELRLNDKEWKRYLKASIWFKGGSEVKGVPEDATVMYIEFDPRSENGFYDDLDYQMESFLRELDSTLKPILTAKRNPVKVRTIKYKIEYQPIPEQRWWLIGSICVGVLLFGLDFAENRHLFGLLNNSTGTIEKTGRKISQAASSPIFYANTNQTVLSNPISPKETLEHITVNGKTYEWVDTSRTTTNKSQNTRADNSPAPTSQQAQSNSKNQMTTQQNPTNNASTADNKPSTMPPVAPPIRKTLEEEEMKDSMSRYSRTLPEANVPVIPDATATSSQYVERTGGAVIPLAGRH